MEHPLPLAYHFVPSSFPFPFDFISFFLFFLDRGSGGCWFFFQGHVIHLFFLGIWFSRNKFFSGKKTPHFFSYIHAPYTRFKSVWWHMLKLVIANQWLIQHFCENCVLNTGFGVSYSFRVKMFVKYLIHTWTRVPIKEVGLFEPRWYSLIGLSSMYPYTKHVI